MRLFNSRQHSAPWKFWSTRCQLSESVFYVILKPRSVPTYPMADTLSGISRRAAKIWDIVTSPASRFTGGCGGPGEVRLKWLKVPQQYFSLSRPALSEFGLLPFTESPFLSLPRVALGPASHPHD